jgi:hypothetical protein
MLTTDLVVSAILESKCVRTRAPLAADELVLSRRAFPALYAGQSDGTEALFLREIERALPAVLKAPGLPMTGRETIRSFMAFVIAQSTMFREEFVHRYLFEFWDTLWKDPDDAIVLFEKYFKGDAAGGATPFVQGILPKIRTRDAATDIVGLGGTAARTLYVIEVKLGELDDRALGQILRYYRLGRSACDMYHHGCDIREVVPVVIAKQVSLEAWDAIPQFFRELLRLYYYRTEQGRVVLVDARRALQSMTRDRLYA